MDAVVESFKPVFRMLGGVFALLVVLRIFLLWWNNSKQKGKRGEMLVARRLRKGLPVVGARQICRAARCSLTPGFCYNMSVGCLSQPTGDFRICQKLF